jgi:hypothetical protein
MNARRADDAGSNSCCHALKPVAQGAGRNLAGGVGGALREDLGDLENTLEIPTGGEKPFAACGRVSHCLEVPFGRPTARRAPTDLRSSAWIALRVRAKPSDPSKKRPRRTASIALISLKKTGAGEGIRTLDPNLGKVVLYP